MKDSFIFHLENAEDLEGLTDTELAAIFRAMIQYQRTGEEPEFEDRVLLAVWKPIRRRMARDNEAYEAKVEANRENGKKGGAPSGNQNAKKNNPTVEKTTQTTERLNKTSETTQTTERLKKQPKQPDTDIDIDTDIDTDIQKEKPTYVGLKKNPTNNPSVDMLRARSGTKWDAYIADFLRQREAKP